MSQAKVSNMNSLPLNERVDEHFRSCELSLFDTEGMMRHTLDCLGALHHRLSEKTTTTVGATPTISYANLWIFSHAVQTIVNHITGFELIDTNSGVNQLLSVFPDDSKRRDGRSWLPVHWAAVLQPPEPVSGGLEYMKQLLQQRPIHAMKGHLPIQLNEISEKKEEKTRAYNGLLPIHFASSCRYPILKNIEILLQVNEHSIQCPDHRGWYPIHWCAYNSSNPDVLKLFIEKFRYGVFKDTKKGILPFQLSAHNRNVSLMEILYEENPEAIDGLDYKGNSPIHYATKSLNYETCQKLFQWKKSLGLIRNFDEELPIHQVFSYIPSTENRLIFRQMETIKLILQYCPETIAFPNQNNFLPLHLGVYYNTAYECIELIYNAYPSAALIQDGDGKLPIQYVQNANTKRLLLKSSPPLIKAGLTDRFSRFIN